MKGLLADRRRYLALLRQANDTSLMSGSFSCSEWHPTTGFTVHSVQQESQRLQMLYPGTLGILSLRAGSVHPQAGVLSVWL
jgi:hypothetical protein